MRWDHWVWNGGAGVFFKKGEGDDWAGVAWERGWEKLKTIWMVFHFFQASMGWGLLSWAA